MKTILLALCALLTAAASAATPAHIVIMTVEDKSNYEAPRTMKLFAEQQLRPLGHRVTIIEGDKPEPHHFAGLTDALMDADLLILFCRRRFPPVSEMSAIREHLQRGKPLLGIRTANHAFSPKPNESIIAMLAPWPTFTTEVLGGENAGYLTKGLPYTASIAPGAAQSPILQGVDVASIRGHQSLYQVLPLATDAIPLIIGTAQADVPAQPIAWTRSYGPAATRIFYTSLGAPEDMAQAPVLKLLVNAVTWTLGK